MGVISAKRLLQTLLTQTCALQIFEHLEALQATGAPGVSRLTKGGTNGHVDASEVLVSVKRREVLPVDEAAVCPNGFEVLKGSGSVMVCR